MDHDGSGEQHRIHRIILPHIFMGQSPCHPVQLQVVMAAERLDIRCLFCDSV